MKQGGVRAELSPALLEAGTDLLRDASAEAAKVGLHHSEKLIDEILSMGDVTGLVEKYKLSVAAQCKLNSSRYRASRADTLVDGYQQVFMHSSLLMFIHQHWNVEFGAVTSSGRGAGNEPQALYRTFSVAGDRRRKLT